MRQLLAASAAEGYIAHNSKRPELAGVCNEVGGKALLAVDEAFSLVTGEPMCVDGLRDAMSYTNVHAKLISDHWKKKVRHRLTPFAHVPLAR